MAEIKWIQIKTNIFDDEKIKLIDAMPERDTIFYTWMRLLVQAGKTNAGGYIFLNEKVPYTEEMLSTIFNRPLNTVRLALKTLSDFEMIEISEDKFIKITNWDKHQNIEGMERIREQTRNRVATHRAKNKALQEPSNGCNVTCNVTVTECNAIEGEEEGEEDREVDINTTPATGPEVDSNYLKFFNENMGHLISPYELETLQSYQNDGMAAEVITLAIREAVEVNKRDMKYVKAILNRWLKNRLLTVEAVNIDKAEFERNKKSNKDYKSKSQNKNNFNNFEQRKYDGKNGMAMDDLERKLLGWDKEEQNGQEQ